MKLFVVLFLIYAGYRLIVPRKEVHLEDKRTQNLSDDDYIDYEEVE